jgi:hypothetical protein
LRLSELELELLEVLLLPPQLVLLEKNVGPERPLGPGDLVLPLQARVFELNRQELLLRVDDELL